MKKVAAALLVSILMGSSELLAGPTIWTLHGTINYNDGTPEGMEIRLPLADYNSKEECESVAGDKGNIKAAAEHSGMKLSCMTKPQDVPVPIPVPHYNLEENPKK